MKNHLHVRIKNFDVKILIQRLLTLMVLLTCYQVSGQVNFTQTTDADFNKGVLSNSVVGSNNVYMPFAATSVGTWLTATVLPQTLAGHKTVSWNDRYVYLVGGYNNTSYVSTVYVATIQAGGISGWTALNPLPVALRDPAVVIGTNTIYVMGGRNASQVFNTIYYASINTDGTIGAWQTSAVTLPANLWGHTATYLMGYIYVIGGTSSTTETTALNTVYYTRVNALNTLSAFSTGTALTAARNRHATVTYNNKLYVTGGYDNSGTRASTVYIATPGLDGTTGTWSTGTALTTAVSNHTAVVSNGLIMVMAGDLGGSLSNSVYYANADVSPLTWNLSAYVLYNNTKDGAAFSGVNQVYYTGGTDGSGAPISVCRYAAMTLSANVANHAGFVSNPFYELGAERVITSLSFTKAYTSPQANLQVTYRTAGSDGVWSDWNPTLSTVSPIAIGLTKQYLQYAIIFTGSTTYNSTLNDMTLTTPGTQLNGSLNGIATFTKALSPYWATSDISFSAGTHTFEAGATILFLPETGLSVGAANVICNGTVADSVKFTYFTNESGKWDGIFYDDNSDAGVSSQFYYTVISNAGFGSNNANLYSYLSNEPKLMNCRISNADGIGVRLNGSLLTIENSVIKSNTEHGVYLENASPTIKNTTLTNNGVSGLALTSSASTPNFINATLSNNQFAFYSTAINVTLRKHLGSITLTGNTYNGIGLPGGNISDNNRWNALSFPIFVMDNLSIGKYGTLCRLTIEPGNTVKFAAGKSLQVGFYSGYHQAGELYAVGVADSLITFTSINGLAGGWEGIYFEDRSDYYGATSVMDYCVVEKGNNYNIYVENTYQPTINHSIIRNAAMDGIKFYGAYNQVMNSSFQNNGRYPVYFSEPHTFPTLKGNTYTGNTINLVGYCGGNLSESRTFQNDGIGYHIMDNILVGKYGSISRLTVKPGLTLSFAPGKGLQVGFYSGYHQGGELYAQGKADSIITFTPFNGLPGGWTGIYFEDRSDWSGATNQLNYCNINKADAYNVLVENTGSVTIDHCTIANAVTDGIRYNGSYGSYTYCAFNNNGRYPVSYLEWSSQPVHNNNTFTGNVVNKIALSGGNYTENKSITNDNVEYLVLDNILLGKYGGIARLTVEPGVTVNFASGKGIQVGFYSGYHQGGELYAEGTSTSWITFRPNSEIAGDWTGILFEDRSDWNGATSSLKYCTVKKGNAYNVRCESTTMPVMDHVNLTQSLGNGLYALSSTLTVKNSTINYNTGYGIYLDASNGTYGGDAALTNNFLNNYGAYDFYNNSTYNIDARYNFWGSGDSTMVHLRIFDKLDNSAKGRVIIGNFAQVPALFPATTVLAGTVKYVNTGANPIKNTSMVIKDFAATTINTTTTNASGVYTFPSMASGNYKLTITPSAPPSAVFNSTDALGILNHFAQIIPLTGMKLAAADVNYSHSINGTDALMVMQRYTGGITTFPAGDFLYNYDTVIMNGGNATGNIEMICFGDVNASYAPAKKSTGPVSLALEGSKVVESFTEFEIPVKVKTGMQIGAISLGFYYPEQYLEITGVKLVNGVTGFSWTAADGLFRMAWCDLNPLDIIDEHVVVLLQMRSKDLSELKKGIGLEIYEYSEFANASAIPYEESVISVPVINTRLTDVGTERNLLSLMVCPNPVNESSVVSFSLEKAGNMRLVLMDLPGNTVKEVAAGNFASGDHKIALPTATLKNGVYLLKLENSDGSESTFGMVKIIVSK